MNEIMIEVADMDNEEIRCSCTMPECITTNYMCKSPSGACFTKPGHNHPQNTHVKARPPRNSPNLGCVELLPQ